MTTDVQYFLQVLLIILVTARIFAELAARMGSLSVMGELLAGVVLGPSLLGWVEPIDAIRMLAEIGLILLLFEVGLETDLMRLRRSGPKSLAVALGGLAFPFLLGFLLGRYAFGLSPLVAMFVGGTLTATSIGITVRVLTDLGVRDRYEGQVVLGAAVLDDIMGVVLLALLYEFAIGGGVNLVNTGKVLVFITVFFALAPVAAKLISLAIRRLDGETTIPGLIPTMIVSLVLFFAWAAREVGAPELLGGFAAGLALSRRFFLPFGVAIHEDHIFAQRIAEQMHPIIKLFTPIFFVMVGLSMNLQEIDWGSGYIWLFSGAMFVAAVAGKFGGALFLRESWQSRIAIGVAMAPRGEVGLVFAELGRQAGVFSNQIYAGMIIVIALTTLLPPFFLKWLYGRYAHRMRPPEPEEA
jgi:Kef-type K+ transport system membrane component KefB